MNEQEATSKLSIADFAAKIKQKYPDYAQIPDAELVQKILAKYPEYAESVDISSTNQSSTSETQPSGPFGPVTSDPMREIGVGAIKGATSTAYGLGSLVGLSRKPSEVPELQPEGGWQTLGKTLEQGAEYFVPGGGEAKIAKAVEMLPGAVRTAAKIGAAGLGTGLVATAQTGEPKAGIAAGALGAGFSAINPAVSELFGRVGSKIQLSTIRPRKVDVVDGFKASTLFKIGLKGNLEQSFQQVESKLNALRQERNALFDPATTSLDIGTVLDSARQKLQSELTQLKNAGQAKRIIGAFDALQSDIYSVLPKDATGQITDTVVDIVKAENAKEGMGMLGAWAYNRPDLEASATEKAANTIYFELKAAIEKAMPQGEKLRDLNKQMQELIPVKYAMLSRIPVEQRNRVLSLADFATLIPAFMSGDAAKLSLFAASRAQKSLRFGNWLVRHGQTPSELSNSLRALFGTAITSAVNTPQ